MPFEMLRPPGKPEKARATLLLTRFGPKNSTAAVAATISLTNAMLSTLRWPNGSWITAAIGSGEDAGKLRLMATAVGPFKLVKLKTSCRINLGHQSVIGTEPRAARILHHHIIDGSTLELELGAVAAQPILNLPAKRNGGTQVAEASAGHGQAGTAREAPRSPSGRGNALDGPEHPRQTTPSASPGQVDGSRIASAKPSDPLRAKPPSVAKSNGRWAPKLKTASLEMRVFVDLDDWTVRHNGSGTATLSELQAHILAVLAAVAPGVLPRSELVKRIWRVAPASADGIISSETQSINNRIAKIGLVVRVVKGIGLALAKRDLSDAPSVSGHEVRA